MLKVLRVRPNGAACFAAPVSGPARKKNSRNEIKLDNEMNKEKKHGVYPNIPVPGPQEDSLTL